MVVDGVSLTTLDGVVLGSGDGARTLPWLVVDDQRGTVRIPQDARAGAWSARAAWKGEAAGEPLAFAVWTPATEPPCAKRFALRVRTERVGRKVLIDHIFADTSEEHHTLVGEQLERLQLEAGPGCAALWLIGRDASRWLLADSVEGEAALLSQAEALAASMEIPLKRTDSAP